MIFYIRSCHIFLNAIYGFPAEFQIKCKLLSLQRRLYPCTVDSGYSGPGCSHLTAFELAVPSTWNTFPSIAGSFLLWSSSSKFSSSERPSLRNQNKVATATFHHITLLFSYLYKMELFCLLTCLYLIT